MQSTATRPTTPSIAPTFPQSAADKAAHAEASYLSPAGQEALRRSYAATQRIREQQYDAALIERGMAEYREWAETAA